MSVKPANNVEVRDEGASQGFVRALDFTGTGVTATVSGSTATIAVSGGGGPGGDLQLDKHVLSASFTITAGWAAYITRYLEIPAGMTLEIGADGDLEIG